MKLYPDTMLKKKEYPLQSILFGHRIQPSQTKYEYLIEFLQVTIAEKRGGSNPLEFPSFVTNDMFPVDVAMEANFKYVPQLRIGLKRFIFLPKSKLDGKAEVDKEAYKACVQVLEDEIKCDNSNKRNNSISIIQNLLRGFSAVNQNRSWFDQNLLPICPEVILPEGMGVKSARQHLKFQVDDKKVDEAFDYHKYTYMCRGGEAYYLHLFNAIEENPKYRKTIETRLHEMITSFPQFSYISSFVQKNWDEYYTASTEVKREVKTLGIIPKSFSVRNKYTLQELSNFLNSKSHPFEKMEMLANGIILQIMRMMYLAASTDKESNCWVVDVNCPGYENPEAKKCAINAFKHNEEVISAYLYRGLEEYRSVLDDRLDDQRIINAAANDTYKLFRKLGKMIGIVIPNTGRGMRFSLSEDIIKFLVLSIIPPKHMVTLDEFVNQLYLHFGMVIGAEQYKKEINRGSVIEIGDVSFLEANVQALSQKLKECGFLRDLSDATSIVENPYDMEETIE